VVPYPLGLSCSVLSRLKPLDIRAFMASRRADGVSSRSLMRMLAGSRSLARFLQQRLEASGNRIDIWQLQVLWHQCRMAKEKLFESPKTQTRPITLLGKGTKLVGGTIKTELAREDLNQILVEGFFPKVASDELPARQRRVGFQELGLPYAADPAITKHLARFLSEQVRNSPEAAGIRRGGSGLACPTHILFNGGVMKAAVLRDRVVEVLNSWLRQEGFETLGTEQILEAPDLEHAVARGAAYYGKARRGRGVRIRSGASRTYYIGIESAMPAVPGMEAPLKALCVVPFGMEEGAEATIPNREFGLVVGEPAEFRFLSSSVRKQDQVGSLPDPDVRHLGHAGPHVGGHRLAGQRGPGGLADETQRVRGRYHPDLMPGLGQEPEQLTRFVRRDTRADAEDDAGRHGPGQPSMASTLSMCSLISRSEMDSGFSWLRVSTSGPTYSSRPSPSCE
jgi:hypothetical protein